MRQCYRAVIRPRSAFVTPLLGDTLFGQCCWTLRHQFGEPALQQWLQGYTDGDPFLVLSSALPEGYLPRPALPLADLGFDLQQAAARKAAKSREWLPLSVLAQPLHTWGATALSADALAAQVLGDDRASLVRTAARTHNSINRQTGSTGSDGGFAPYQRQLTWYHPRLTLAVYAVVDAARIAPDQVRQALAAIGQHGFGKDASSGLGKFELEDFSPWQVPAPARPDAWYTLAPCAPQGLRWVEGRCHYRPFVRFGRHGDRAVHSGQPFKSPVLLAAGGAVLTPADGVDECMFTGQGLGGMSRAIPETVHQGYAPVWPVALATKDVNA